MIDLSIIIVNWNTRDLLVDCLRSVFETAGDLELEVFVVDNASSDGSAAMVREQFPQVRLIENAENVGFARANNQAIRESSGAHILLLNPDTVLQQNSLNRMLAFTSKRHDIGAVGCNLTNCDGTYQQSWGVFPSLITETLGSKSLSHLFPFNFLLHGLSAHQQPSSLEPIEVDWVRGACLLTRRDVLDQVGLLDEMFFMYSEEMDWCYRVRKFGWKIYNLPDVVIIHNEGSSAAQVPLRSFLHYYESRLRFFKKHYRPCTVLCLRLITIFKAICNLINIRRSSLLVQSSDISEEAGRATYLSLIGLYLGMSKNRGLDRLEQFQ